MPIKQLFEKYLHNNITKEELTELRQLVNNESSFTELDEVIDLLLREQYQGKHQELDKQKMFTEILEKSGVKTSSATSINIWYKYAAAIIITLGVVVLFYYGNIINKPRATQSFVTVTSDQIKPGSNVATLTLSNGKVIVLDTVNNGKIATHDQSNAIKLDAGSLAYNIDDSEVKGDLIYNMISTPRGGQYHIILSDGSKVWLNSASSLYFPAIFPGNSREITITGEAYFEIAKDNKRPFTVRANGVTTEVLGTIFNINAYQDEPVIKTTLVEGKIRVNDDYSTTVMTPGQKVTLKNKSHFVENANVSHEIAWKNGFFEFYNTPIESVMRQLSRWYNFEVVYKGKIDKLFHATIPRDASISQVLRVLEHTDAVHFEVNDNTVTIKP